MTSSDSFDRDELIAAYLDGEATLAERAQVEADPDLVERAELMRSVADMVAQPVNPAPAALRSAHIAAALEASSTTPVVTSLQAAKQRRRVDFTKVLGAAAAGLLVLFAGVAVLSSGNDGDDTATETSDQGTEETESFDFDTEEGVGGEDELSATEMPEAEGAEEEASDAEAVMEAPQAEADMGEADMAEDASDSTSAESSRGGLDGLFLDTAVIVVPTSDAFLDEVGRLVRDESGDGSSDDSGESIDVTEALCIEELLQYAGQDEIVAAGFAIIGGNNLEFVVVATDQGSVVITADAATCALENRRILNP